MSEQKSTAMSAVEMYYQDYGGRAAMELGKSWVKVMARNPEILKPNSFKVYG